MAWGRGLLTAFALTAALGCGREAVPAELIGHWTSDDPRYADRSLEIGAETLAFGGGEGMRTTYRMQGVERDVEEGTAELVYRLFYDAAGSPEHELRVRFPAPGRLRIDNHTQVWTRTGAASAGG
jgi:hypothetical protein